MDTRARAFPVLLALGGTWGASFLFIKVLDDNTGPVEIAFGRVFLGAIAVAAYMLVARHNLVVSRGLVARVALMAIGNNVLPMTMIPWAEERIPSGTASILNATVPIFTTLVAVVALDEERFTPARLGGLLLAFVGVGVLTGGDILHVTSASVRGELAVVAAAACYGATTVYTRRTLHGQDPVSVSLLQLVLASAMLFPAMFALSGGSPDLSLNLKAWGSILALGLAGTGLAYIAYFWLIENLGSVRATLVTYIVPIVGVFLGWLAYDESVGLNTIAGGLLIVGGVASVLRGRAPVREPPEPEGVPAAAMAD